MLVSDERSKNVMINHYEHSIWRSANICIVYKKHKQSINKIQEILKINSKGLFGFISGSNPKLDQKDAYFGTETE